MLFTYYNIDYAIFQNSKIEFELPYRNPRSSINRRGVRRCPATFDNIYHTSNSIYNRRTIRYNRYGQVLQIGPTHISYNRRNIVSKIEGLDILYKNAVVRKVGGLMVLYNRRRQIVAAKGHVLLRNFYGHGHNCNDHNFGVFNEDDTDVNQDWDNKIYFKRKSTTQ